MQMFSRTTDGLPLQNMTDRKSKTVLRTVFDRSFFVFSGVVALGFLWHIGAFVVDHGTANGLGSLILPKPAEVMLRVWELGFGEMTDRSVFWTALLGSLVRAISGFSFALVLATGLGIMAGFWPLLHQLLYPFLLFLRSVPVMSVILYLLLFVPTPLVAVWVSFLVVFPMLYTNVVAGFDAVDQKLLEMSKLYGLSAFNRLRHVYLPNLLPYWLAGCLTGMGLNIKAVITAEAMSLPDNSFGMLMTQARNYLDTTGLLAITVWIILLALLLDILLLVIKWILMHGRRYYVVYRRKSQLRL